MGQIKFVILSPLLSRERIKSNRKALWNTLKTGKETCDKERGSIRTPLRWLVISQLFDLSRKTTFNFTVGPWMRRRRVGVADSHTTFHRHYHRHRAKAASFVRLCLLWPLCHATLDLSCSDKDDRLRADLSKLDAIH